MSTFIYYDIHTHNLQIFRVIPFVKRQNDTQTTVKRLKTRERTNARTCTHTHTHTHTRTRTRTHARTHTHTDTEGGACPFNFVTPQPYRVSDSLGHAVFAEDAQYM